MPKTVHAYIRVSTEKQVEAETPQNQKKAINDYSARNNLQIITWFSDEGISGFTKDRQGLTSLLANIDQVDGIIVYDVDRLTRNFELGTSLMFRLRDMGKLIYVARTGEIYDFQSKEQQLIHVIKSWSAEIARDQIKQNQKRGIERAKLKYGRWGPKPKQINWKEFDELRAAGISITKCANYFKVHRNTLHKLIKKRTN